MKKIFYTVSMLIITSAFILSAPLNNNSNIHAAELKFKNENREVEKIEGLDSIVKMQNVFRQIAKSVMPAVVSIHVEGEVTMRNPHAELFRRDPFFKRFFGEMDEQQKRKIQGQGSGFIFTPDGYIFSNHHVINNAKKITVTLSDERSFEAKLVGSDPETDIALLKIEADNLPVAAIGDPSQSEIGDWVIAIGNPFGLAGSYTFGTISAIGRPGMQSGFQQFIQTDVPVNPGNSGGPLVNIRGQVIGINTAIQSRTGGYMGISFAVPVDIAKDVASQIASTGKVVRGYLGIVPAEIDPATRKIMKLKDDEGILVSKMEPGSPAEKSGLLAGDIITKVNNIPVNRPDKLQREIGAIKPGSSVSLEVLRENKKIRISVTLLARPVGDEWNNQKQADKLENQNAVSSDQYNFNGTVFREAPQNYLSRNGANYGLAVISVKNGSLFSGILRKGEIVTEINNIQLKNIQDLKNFAENNKKTKSYTLKVVKGGFLSLRSIENK
jgi:serine protease Do